MNTPEIRYKIAVCLSGQVRTGIRTSENLLRWLNQFQDPNMFDFFIHTWDIETCSPHETPPEFLYTEPRPVKPIVFDLIKKIYNPISMTVENYNNYLESTKGRIQLPMHESIQRCNNLKKAHERANNFVYYRVLRLRFDLVFEEDHCLLDELKYMAFPKKEDCLHVLDYWNKLPHWTEDIAWLGKSHLIDIASDFVNDRAGRNPTELNGLEAQHHFNRYLKNNGVICNHWKNNTIHIYRDHHDKCGISIADFKKRK